MAFGMCGCSAPDPAEKGKDVKEGPKSDYMKAYNKAKATIGQVNKIQQDRYGAGVQQK